MENPLGQQQQQQYRGKQGEYELRAGAGNWGLLDHWPRQAHQDSAWQQPHQQDSCPIWQHRHTPLWQQLQQHYSHTSQQERRREGRSDAVKRSCPSLYSEDEEEERLPSIKRQRVSVSAMERLLAACTLGGTTTEQGGSSTDTREDKDNRTGRHESSQEGHLNCHTIRTGSITENRGTQRVQCQGLDGGAGRGENLPQREQNSMENTIHKIIGSHKSVPQLSSSQKEDKYGLATVGHEPQSKVADQRGMVADRSGEDNKSQVESALESGEVDSEYLTDESVQIRMTEGGSKRSAEEEGRGVHHNSDEEAPHLNKRVRKLKRGLRLCSNITCYIEQVLYNC